MGNAAGQRSQAFQLLSGEGLGLRAPGIGDILSCADHARGLTVLIQYYLGCAGNLPQFTVGLGNLKVDRVPYPLCKAFSSPLVHPFPILWRHCPEKPSKPGG